jgi:hypothetical protein
MSAAVIVRVTVPPPGVLEGYGARAQTRTDHVNQVKAYLGFRSATADDLDQVHDWLANEAMEGLGRYLVTMGYVHDTGRTIEVEVCDDPDCIEAVYDRMG